MKMSPINADSECEPLCRSYVCAVFDVLRLRIQDEAGPRYAQLFWAVGVLSNKTPHYLGAWFARDPKDAQWHAMAGDLHDRGIERLRIALTPDPVRTQAALAPCYRNLTVLPVPASVDDPAIDPTLSGHRQYIERALVTSGPLRLRLKRALARHGPFVDIAAAAALVRRSADRYLYTHWPEPPGPPIRIPRAALSRTLAAAGR
jgi:hypothetical protein